MASIRSVEPVVALKGVIINGFIGLGGVMYIFGRVLFSPRVLTVCQSDRAEKQGNGEANCPSQAQVGPSR